MNLYKIQAGIYYDQERDQLLEIYEQVYVPWIKELRWMIQFSENEGYITNAEYTKFIRIGDL